MNDSIENFYQYFNLKEGRDSAGRCVDWVSVVFVTLISWPIAEKWQMQIACLIIGHMFSTKWLGYCKSIPHQYMSQWKLKSSAIANSPIDTSNWDLPLVLLPIGTTARAVSNSPSVTSNWNFHEWWFWFEAALLLGELEIALVVVPIGSTTLVWTFTVWERLGKLEKRGEEAFIGDRRLKGYLQ